MPRGRKGKTNQGAGTRKPLLDPPPPAPTDAQVHSMHTTSYNVPTFTSQASLQSLRGHILSLLTGLVSDITEMKYSLMESLADPPPPPPTVDNLTFQDVDAIIEWLKEERGNYKHHLLILTHFVSDLSKMKHLITGPTLTPEPKILPFCLQEEIMKRLPVKSLLRFRSVSRSWKSLIDSSRFIGAHSHSNQPHHLLVEYRDKHHEVKYVSFADDDSFTHRCFLPAFPPSIGRPRLAGSSSYGLFCLECYDLSSGKVTAVIWNPSFRKLLAIDLPEVPYGRGLNDFFGFGVCPVTLDPKIVHITHLCSPSSEVNYEESEHLKPKFWEVSVCNLSSGRKFRNLSKSSSNLPNVSMRVSRRSSYVVIDRLIYWYAVEDFHSSDGVLSQKSRNLIMSFDITEEKFEVVELPDCLASLRHEFLSVSKLRESLVVLESNENRDSCGVWKMMGHGSQFTKLFTIKNPSDWGTISVVGFRKTGGPFIEVPSSNFYSPTQLVVYEPNSKHCEDLILEYSQSHIVESYVKTLLLIGHSACTSY